MLAPVVPVWVMFLSVKASMKVLLAVVLLTATHPVPLSAEGVFDARFKVTARGPTGGGEGGKFELGRP